MTRPLRYLFVLGHPAHFHLFRVVIGALQQKGHEARVLIKSKDVLETLVRTAGWPHTNILRSGRRASRVGRMVDVIRREGAVLREAADFRPDVIAGSTPEVAHTGWLLRVPSLLFTEDDWHVVPQFARVTYPFARYVVAPVSCDMGPWTKKTTAYPGYHELAYLHPNHFTPSRDRIAKLLSERPYVILRFAQLTAYHDAGRRGIDRDIALRLVRMLEPHGRIYISAERPLEAELEPFRFPIAPENMHDALAFAAMYIGDSQTMTAEAAVLGTPSIRFNDFVGQIGYLEELQHRYGLTVGVPRSSPDDLFQIVRSWLARRDLAREWSEKRAHMLTERVDTADFFVRLLERFPESIHALRPDA